MDPAELDIDGASARRSPRKAVLEALDRLLRAQAALSEQRDPEGAFGLLRPARDDEVALIEAVFLHCSVPLPDALRAVYRRTLGVGNPVSALPVLAPPFLRAVLPGEGFEPVVVGLEAFETGLGLHRDAAASERPPFLALGHAAPAGLTVSRNGLWSLGDYQGRGGPPRPEDFALGFEAAFCAYVDQVLLVWANDLAGDPVRRRDLDLSRGARLAAMPAAVREALAHLVAKRGPSPKARGDVQPLDNADLLRGMGRGEGLAALQGPFTTVVGLPYGDAPEVAARIGLGDLLRLRPVDDNPHDPNAVEVWRDGPPAVRLGFVARAEAPALRALPGEASSWRLRVVGRTDAVLATRLEREPPGDGATGPHGPTAGQEQDLFAQGGPEEGTA